MVFYKLLIKFKNNRFKIENAPDNLTISVPIQYPQGPRELCLIKSFASALFYIGLNDESGQINSQSNGYEHLSLDKAYKNSRGHENICTNDWYWISL